MRPGDTFVLLAQGAHLRIVVAGPCQHGRILFVGVTSDAPAKDRTCTLDVGDHPFLHHTSLIHYGDAMIGESRQLLAAVPAGHIEVRESITPDLLLRIQQGFNQSMHAKPIHIDFINGRCRCA